MEVNFSNFLNIQNRHNIFHNIFTQTLIIDSIIHLEAHLKSWVRALSEVARHDLRKRAPGRSRAGKDMLSYVRYGQIRLRVENTKNALIFLNFPKDRLS